LDKKSLPSEPPYHSLAIHTQSNQMSTVFPNRRDVSDMEWSLCGKITAIGRAINWNRKNMAMPNPAGFTAQAIAGRRRTIANKDREIPQPGQGIPSNFCIRQKWGMYVMSGRKAIATAVDRKKAT